MLMFFRFRLIVPQISFHTKKSQQNQDSILPVEIVLFFAEDDLSQTLILDPQSTPGENAEIHREKNMWEQRIVHTHVGCNGAAPVSCQ